MPVIEDSVSGASLIHIFMCLSVVPAGALFVIMVLGWCIGYGAQLKDYEKNLVWAGFCFIGESKSAKERVGHFLGIWGPFADSHNQQATGLGHDVLVDGPRIGRALF